MNPKPGGIHDGVAGRAGQLGGPPSDLLGAPILRSAVQSHEADVGAQDAFLPDPGHRQQFGEVHRLRFAHGPVGHVAATPIARRAATPRPVQVAMKWDDLGKLPYTTMANAIFTHPLLAEGLNTLFSMFDATV